MICRNCDTNLADDATFCSVCGNIASEQNGATAESTYVQTFQITATGLPSDPYISDVSTAPTSLVTTADMQNLPETPLPLSALPRRRTSPIFYRSLLTGTLIAVLLTSSVGALLFLILSAYPISSAGAKNYPPPTSAPQPGTMLYQANWSNGMNGWTGTRDWQTQNNMLVSDGTFQPTADAGPTILAPYLLPASGNFAIEARIQAAPNAAFDPILFHGALTPSGWQGYKLTVCNCQQLRITSDNSADILGLMPFAPGSSRHTYRIEVRGSAITATVDGNSSFTTSDSRFLSGKQVGIKTSSQLIVSSFTITAL
jgi:hypothetical protein